MNVQGVVHLHLMFAKKFVVLDIILVGMNVMMEILSLMMGAMQIAKSNGVGNVKGGLHKALMSVLD